MSENGETKLGGFAVTADEFEGVCQEISSTMTEMKDVINIHAEAIALHRYILDKFVPKPLLAQAVKEYYDKRVTEIESTETDASQSN